LLVRMIGLGETKSKAMARQRTTPDQGQGKRPGKDTLQKARQRHRQTQDRRQGKTKDGARKGKERQNNSEGKAEGKAEGKTEPTTDGTREGQSIIHEIPPSRLQHMADAMGPPLRAHIRCAYSITLSSFLHPPRYPGEAKQDKHLCTRKWGPKIFMSNSNGLHRIKRGEEVEHGWLCNVHLWSLALIAGLFGGSVACW
jgi:hypothetical protein